jgi:hypothetical protein
MNKEEPKYDVTITEDLKHILNVLKPKDAEAVLALKEELSDNWNKRQIFRTETEMRISVLNDGVHPTPASKYWQSVREMGAHFDALMGLTFEMRRNEVKRMRLEKELEEAQEKGDKLTFAELQIDLDENLYSKASMTQIAQDRVRELKLWSKIKDELDNGTFDTTDVNQHQAQSFKHILENRVASLNQQSNPGEVVNAIGPLQTLNRLVNQEGKIAEFGSGTKYLKENNQ